MQDKYFRWNI